MGLACLDGTFDGDVGRVEGLEKRRETSSVNWSYWESVGVELLLVFGVGTADCNCSRGVL